jgi:hypothetical protein
MRKSMETILPPGFLEHRRTARKEMLLAFPQHDRRRHQEDGRKILIKRKAQPGWAFSLEIHTKRTFSSYKEQGVKQRDACPCKQSLSQQV